jgi:hypothetical protein
MQQTEHKRVWSDEHMEKNLIYLASAITWTLVPRPCRS